MRALFERYKEQISQDARDENIEAAATAAKSNEGSPLLDVDAMVEEYCREEKFPVPNDIDELI
jgi:hypothetical protein